MNAQEIPRHGLDRDEHFKKEIQFEVRAKRITASGGIVGTSLPNPSSAPQLQGGWSLKKEDISNGQKDYVFEKAKESLSVKFYYATDIEKSKSCFLQIATNTNMTVIPYQNGPSDIGDISLVGKYKNKDRIIFLKKNVVVDIRRDHSEIDILNIARWIQDHLLLVPIEEVTKQMPMPHKIIASRKMGGIDAPMAFHANEAMVELRGRVGELLVIHLDPPMGTDVNRYDLEQDWADGLFQPVGMEGLGRLERAIRPLKSGLAAYKYVLIDRQTLLSYPGEIKINIQP